MLENADLRLVLVRCREMVIYHKWSDDIASRKHGILRRSMIDWLIVNKPETKEEWLRLLPRRLLKQTDACQFDEFAPVILSILRRHRELQSLRLRAM